MKRSLFRLFNLLMACVVLLSSTGFGLVEHSCQMRGKRLYAGVEKAGCNGCSQTPQQTQKVPTVKKTDCCKEEQRYENVDFTSSLSHLFAKFIKAVSETVSAGVVAALVWVANWITGQTSTSVSATPAPLPSPGVTF